MGKMKEKADEYHEQFAARIIKALEEGTAPWQKPCPPYLKNRQVIFHPWCMLSY